MKALTLTQPWASLVSLHAKKIETRSWSTNYTGLLAIHAAKRYPIWAREIASDEPFRSALHGSPPMPLGRVLCVVTLMGCRRTEDVRGQLDAKELAFGDYSDGRFAWFFEFVREVDGQPEVKGHLGVWNWEESAVARKAEAR